MAGLLKQVRAEGKPITIERRGKPLAALVSIEDLELLEAQRSSRADREKAQTLFVKTEKLAQLGHWEWDEVEGRCSYCSQGLADLAGVTVEEYLARSSSFKGDLEWVHLDDRDRWRSAITQAAAARSGFSIVYRHLRADGSAISVHEESSPVTDGKGNWIATHGYVQDISDRIEAEQALSESEARFRDFAEAASDWFWEMGPDLRFRWFSQGYERWFGKSYEQLIGKRRWDLTSEEFDSAKWRAHRADLEARRPIRDFRYQARSDSGEISHRSVSAVPVFDDQRVFQGYRGVSSDITDRISAQQALEHAHEELGRRVEARTAELVASRIHLVDAIESISEAFILFDADERLVLCNDKYRELLPEIADLLTPGTSLEDLLWAIAEKGQMADSVGNAEAWVRERLELYRTPHGAIEQQLLDGRWILASDHRTRDGGLVGIRSDITEQKRADEALKTSVQRLRDIAEATSDWFWELDADLRFTYVSDRYREVAGVEPDFFFGKRWEEVFPRSVQRQPNAWRAFNEAVAARRSFRDFVHDDFRGDGQRYVIRNTGKAVFAADGSFRGYRGTSNDITKQVQVENELRRSEEQFRDMTANLPGIVYQFVIDAEGSMSFPYVSPTITAMLGLDPDEVVGNSDIWFSIVHPEDLPGLEASIWEAHRTLKPWLWEGRMFRGEGEVGWFRGSSISRQRGDGSVLWNGIVLDITEHRAAEQALRESESRFKAVVENSPSAIYLKDLDGRYLLINRRCTEWYGVTQADARNKTYEELYPDEAAAGMDVRDAEVLQSGKTVEWETAFDHQDGSRHHTWVVKSPVFNEQGEIVGICGINNDVTERKRAEAAQQESEQRLRSVVDNSPSAIYLKDPDGRFRMVNPRFEESYGVTAAEAIGKTTDEILSSVYAERYMEIDRSVLKSGKIEEHEVESPYADGSLHQLLTTKFPVHDANGEIIGVGTIDIDVTERRRAEAGQRASEALFKAFVEHSPTPISIKDLDGRYSLFSPSAVQYYGAPVEQAVGKTVRDLFSAKLADVIEAEDQATMSGAPAMGRDEERVIEYGNSALLLTKFPIQGDDGTAIGLGTIAVDVTERERIRKELIRSQDRLAAALRQAKIAYWRFDRLTEEITEWSVEAGQILGLAEQDLPKQLDGYLERVHPDDRARVEQAYQRQLLSSLSDPKYHLEYRFLRPEGQVIWLSEEATAECDPSERTLGHLGTIQDITANKQAEEQLRQAQKMEAIGQLTGGVAHDFNNLLAIIQGNAEFLRDDVGPGNDFLRAIQRAAGLGAELTRRLLAFSRQQPLRPLPIDLADLVAGMSDLLSRSLGETIEIATRTQADLWTAAADPGQVQNALLNLAINARDAMPDGGRLSIECSNARITASDLSRHRDAVPGDYVVLAVRDQGTGMSAEDLEHAFEPFFTTKAFGQGSGLGLSMVYGFARQSGGFVELSSAPGKGTCARLYLLRQLRQMADPPARPTLTIPEGRGEIVLVIEDDDQVRKVAMKILEGLGYGVLGVPEAASAWSLLERDDRVELILSDVVLPGGQSGIAFARDLETRYPDIGVVFMSGYPTDAATRDGKPGRDSILLNKPFERADLAKAVRQTLDS